MPRVTCAVDRCEKAIHNGGKGWCGMHYTRWRRTGDPGDASSRYGQYDPTCAADGCDRPSSTRGYCGMHYQRSLKTGTLDDDPSRRWSGEVPSYRTAHRWVTVARGLASTHACVDCCRRARHWSYAGTDPNELRDRRGVFSIDPMHYAPRCVACHMRLDKVVTHCRHGHEYTPENTMRNGVSKAGILRRRCRACWEAKR